MSKLSESPINDVIFWRSGPILPIENDDVKFTAILWRFMNNIDFESKEPTYGVKLITLS